MRSAFKDLEFYRFDNNGFPTVEGFAGSCSDRWGGSRPPYFSGDYPHGRNYATSRGGETVDAMVIALRDLERLGTDPEAHRRHVSDVEKKLDRFPQGVPYRAEIQRRLERCRDRARIGKTA